MNPSEKNKPTNRQARFVAPEGERSRTLRRFLAGLWIFVRKQRPVPEKDGDISQWICQLHGLAALRRTNGKATQDGSDLEMGELLRTFGPELSPEKMRGNLARSDAIQRDARVQGMIEAAKRGDSATFNAGFKEIAESMQEVWLPNFKPPFDLSLSSVLQMRRSLRAILVGTALYHVHPIKLIARAWRGDKSAVLDLIRIDKLFLQDRCTLKVIRDAALRNDQAFIDQLANAQKYQPRLRRRDLIHLYFQVLFVLELVGQPLPRTDELQRLLDPQGDIFRGCYAFERDLQRWREHFNKIFAEAYSEFPTILSFYQPASPKGN